MSGETSKKVIYYLTWVTETMKRQYLSTFRHLLAKEVMATKPELRIKRAVHQSVSNASTNYNLSLP